MPPEPSAIATLGFVARGRALAMKSTKPEAIAWMIDANAPSKAVEIVKAPIGGLDMGDLGVGGVTPSQWASSSQTASAFFRILSDGGFVRAPIGARVALTVVPATGAAVGEASVIPMTAATVTSVTLEIVKTASLLVVSDLLLRDTSPGGQTSFNRALLSAISDQIDAAFLAKLLADPGAFSVASSGPTANSAQNDLRTAMLNVATGSTGRLYWICGISAAKRAAALASTTGASVFTAMSPNGGELAGLPCIVSSGIPSDSLVLLDASGVAVDAGVPEITASVEATIEMNSAPVGTAAAVLTSMFHTDSTAIRAGCWFGCAPLRSDVVASITSVAWAAA